MDIRTIEDGEIITEPGAYRMSIEHYHTQCCAGPSISSGGLRTIVNQSPMDFFAFSDLNPTPFERPESDALTFGRAAHATLLGEEDFDRGFIVLPEDAPGRPTKTQLRAADEGRVSKSYTERNDFWRRFDFEARGRTVVRESWIETIVHMSAALQAHPLVGPLFDGEPELSLIWQDEQTGVWLKARPDMLPRMGGVKADLKTTADASLRAVMRDTEVRGYDMQAALGCIGAEVVLGQKIETDVLVFVQKTAPFHVTPVEIDEDAMHWAKLKIRRGVNAFAECLRTGIWPGPVEGIPRFNVPTWRVEQYAAEQAAGLMPHDFFAPFGAFGDGATA